MGDREILELQLEKVFPEDKSLSPGEVSDVLKKFFADRGISIKTGYLMKGELSQELISRIKSSLEDFKPEIKKILQFKSDRLIRNKYYEMVYAILDHHHFGIANKNGKLIKITYCRFSEIFDVDRKTISGNQSVVDFYYNKDKTYDRLKTIFWEIEEVIKQ